MGGQSGHRDRGTYIENPSYQKMNFKKIISFEIQSWVMVAKLIVKDCPSIEKINLGSSLDEVRANLATINFDQPGIHILKLQPGVGKTYRIKEFLKSQKSFLIATGSHKLLSGEYDELTSNHWYGFKHVCQKYKKVKKLKEHNVPIDLICFLQGCDKSKCEYWLQFRKRKVIAPYHFIPTNRVRNKTKDKAFKFKLLVFDEALDNYNTIKSYKEEIDALTAVIGKYVSIKDLINEFNGYFGTKKLPPIPLVVTINGRKIQAIEKAIGSKNWEDVAEIAKLDIYGLRKFIYYSNIYEGIDSYPEPYFYYAMDLALQGVPIVFLDATFDEKALKVLLGRYIYENKSIERSSLIDEKLGNLDDFKITIYESRLVNKDKIIYKMDMDNYYYRGGFFEKGSSRSGKVVDVVMPKAEKTIRQLREFIIRSKRKYASIGIVTYRSLMKEFNDLGATEYFHNLRGSNLIKNVDALFIIGSPENTTDIVYDYNNLVLKDYKKERVVKLTYITKDGKYYMKRTIPATEGRPKRTIILPEPVKEKKSLPHIYDVDDPEDLSYFPGVFEEMKRKGVVDAYIYYKFPEFGFDKSESEKYQAIHRARPFENEVDIYIFGDVSEQVKKEFKIEYVDKMHTKFHFIKHFRGIYPRPLYELINDTYFRNHTLKSADIARELNLYKNKEKKEGWNTSFVTAIINGSVNMKQINRIHHAINKNGPDNHKAIKRQLRGLKVDKEFINDCIYYAKEGNFVGQKT
jgi:hypothetical protein